VRCGLRRGGDRARADGGGRLMLDLFPEWRHRIARAADTSSGFTPTPLATLAEQVAPLLNGTPYINGAVTTATGAAAAAGNSAASAAGQAVAAGQSAGQSGVSAVAAQTAQTGAETARDSAQNISTAAANIIAQAAFRISQGMDGNLPFVWQGFWNAATNTPALASGSGTAGYAYVVTNAGTTDLDGNAAWEPFDIAYFNGTQWLRGAGAGLPVAAPKFVATIAAQVAGMLLGTASGGNAFEIADAQGYQLTTIDTQGNLSTAGDTIQAGSMTFDAGATGMLQIRDTNGFVGWEIDSTGAVQAPDGAANPSLGPIAFEIVEDGLTGVLVMDRNGYVAFDTTGLFGSALANAPSGFTAADIARHDAANLARSALLSARRPSANYAAPVWGYSYCDSAGQSELMGWFSVPPRTVNTPASLGALMMGSMVYGADSGTNVSTDFVPGGGSSALQPIVGTSYNIATDTQITRPGNQLCAYASANVTIVVDSSNAQQCTLTTTDTTVDFTKGTWSATSGQSGTCPGLQVGDTIQMDGFTGDAASNNLQALIYGLTQAYTVNAVSAQSLTLTVASYGNSGSQNPVAVSGVSGVSIQILWAGGYYLGEAQCVQATVSFRRFQLQARGLLTDPSRQLVTYCSAIGGQSIAALSKGANPNIYNRGISAFQTLAGIAQAANVSFGCYLIEWLQGGNDGSTSYATYLAALKAYHTTKAADYMAISGQTAPPRMEIAVLSQFNGTTFDNMGIHRAQVDYCEANPDRAYCVGAIYPAFDYYAHVASNGEAWFGAMRAKKRDELFNGGRIPFCVRMTAATSLGSEVLVDFQAPVPPLTIKAVGVGQESLTLPNYGLVVVDGSGNTVPIASTALVGELTILITLTAPPPAGAWVYCAPAGGYGADGSSNIFDSDPTVASIPYQWTPGDGTSFPEQQAQASGSTMSLANPAVPYAVQITPGATA
jgi:hypothetical protein